jgi:hypothetical protein
VRNLELQNFPWFAPLPKRDESAHDTLPTFQGRVSEMDVCIVKLEHSEGELATYPYGSRSD